MNQHTKRHKKNEITHLELDIFWEFASQRVGASTLELYVMALLFYTTGLRPGMHQMVLSTLLRPVCLEVKQSDTLSNTFRVVANQVLEGVAGEAVRINATSPSLQKHMSELEDLYMKSGALVGAIPPEFLSCRTGYLLLTGNYENGVTLNEDLDGIEIFSSEFQVVLRRLIHDSRSHDLDKDDESSDDNSSDDDGDDDGDDDDDDDDDDYGPDYDESSNCDLDDERSSCGPNDNPDHSSNEDLNDIPDGRDFGDPEDRITNDVVRVTKVPSPEDELETDARTTTAVRPSAGWGT
ncbi:hypothetical protein K458DRAFT_407173 [Lentithecium fluviatile CBS 122367]|uniref:Uncharacterized protein n=1 Tax=Lentithecium fluviatile CBS 122367 TaxID=1168545 RepID=A0A6G1IR18_9PLEO|nr:hypothetical protein K458DRAFT_407173 [Lentithecium fluviatile CBS 122367]